MKKLSCLALTAWTTAFSLLFSSAAAFAADRTVTVTDYRAGADDRYIRICVAGQDLKFLSSDTYGLPFIDSHSRIQIPVRKFAKAIGGTVQYSEEDKTVTITDLDSNVVFQLGCNVMLCNGTAVEMDTTAQNIGGRTYIPLRAISEALGYSVEYTAEEAVSADCRISCEEVASAEIEKRHTLVVGDYAAAESMQLTREELDTLVELYNQMCMTSPRYEVDLFDTVSSYNDWIYLTMRDGSTVDLCRRMQDEWEVRCFLWSSEQNKTDNFVMHSSDLYLFIARLYNPDWTPIE